jgi:DNA-binding transcriptional ArsR family regulator
MKTSNIVKSFIALGHDSRLSIYNLLMEKGENGMPAGEIGKQLNIPGATLSFHLSSLSDAKLIDSKRQGRAVYYYVRYKRIKKLIKYLSVYCDDKKFAGEIDSDGGKDDDADD